MSRPVLLLLLMVIATAAPAAVAAEADVTTDQVLELQAAQAESLDALDAEIETTVTGEDGVSHTAQARIAYDKVEGTTRVQKIDSDGNVNMDIKTEGTTVSYLTPSGWRSVELDAQTKATLVDMGIDFGDEAPAAAVAGDPTSGQAKVAAVSAPTQAQRKKQGLAGRGRLPKDKAQRRLAKRQRVKDHIKRHHDKFRSQRRQDLDQDRPQNLLSAADLDQPLTMEADGLLSLTPTAQGRRPRTGKLRALWQRRLPKPAKLKGAPAPESGAHDATLELVDEDTGVSVEVSQFMRADRMKDMLDMDGQGGEMDVTALAEKRGNAEYAKLKAKKHPFKAKKRKLPKWARRVVDADGVELVEIQRMKILKMRRVGGVVLPEETEQTDVTAVGEVKQRVKWRNK